MNTLRTSGKIENTAANCRRPEWLFGSNPGAIEAQEAEGQRQLVTSRQLPTEIYCCSGDGKAMLEALGVKFGQPGKDDPQFCDVELPLGWEIRATGHSMWSDLFDEKGERVASIFYKAAFYDRQAFMTLDQ